VFLDACHYAAGEFEGATAGGTVDARGAAGADSE
jgi:hypothetical protein